MKQPHIVIIILHYKHVNDTRECLWSLKKVQYPNFSVILVNNDSSDRARQLQDEFGSSIHVIQNEKNLGFAEGNNVGIRHALADSKVDAVLILNNDTTVEPNFLDEMIKVEADMVAPRMMQFDNRDKIDNLGIVLMSSGLSFNRLNENQKLFCPSAGCSLYSRKLLETIVFASEAKQSRDNYFDADYFAYAEDLDLGWRARNQGFEPMYARDAVVYHKGSSATSKMSDFAVYHTYRNVFWTQFKNLPTSLILWQSPWLLLGRVFIFFFYIFKGRVRVIFKAYVDGETGALKMVKKRAQILKNKNVLNKKILSWFEKGLFPKNLIK
jgi:GT2 family glycosyltransferase